MKKYNRIIITATMILTVIAALTVSCFAFDNTGNTEYMEELRARANSYYEKVKGATSSAETNTYNAVKVYIDRIDALRQETDRDTAAEMELENKRGMAVGILSWIYYSHTEEIQGFTQTDAEAVKAEYEKQRNAIDKANLDFFEGNGVNACYTNLLNEIYTRRIELLRSSDNGNGLVNGIVDDALKLVISRCAYSESFGEDAENCRIYYAEVAATVELQTLRDKTIVELSAVVGKIYPDGEFDMSTDGKYAAFFKELNDPALQEAYICGEASDGDAIKRFNVALSLTVADILTPQESFGAYKKSYLNSLTDSVFLKVGEANGAENVEHVSVLDMFQNYSLCILSAEAKDELSEYATSLGRDSALDIIVLEYAGIADGKGILDNAKNDDEVAAELLAGKMRCLWYDTYRDALSDIEKYLGEGSDKGKEAKALYFVVDGKIKIGDRANGDSITENLAIDMAEMSAIVVRAESERFTSDHDSIIEKNEVVISDKAALSEAIADSALLSPEAEKLLEDVLSALGEKYKDVIKQEIKVLVTEDLAKAQRQSAADTLAELIAAVKSRGDDGRFALVALKDSSDIYLEKAGTVKELLDGYCSYYLSGGSEYFGKEVEGVVSDGASEIIEAVDGSEAQKKDALVLKLKRFAALESIFGSARGYDEVDGIPQILERAREDIEVCSTDVSINVYVAERVAQISEIIRVFELKNAANSIVTQSDSIKSKIESYEYISAEQKAALLGELENIKEWGQTESFNAANGSAVKKALRDTLAKLSLLEDKANNAELDACLSNAKAALTSAYGKKEDYSAENYAAILALIEAYTQELGGVRGIAEYIEIRDRGIAAILAIEDLLEAAKRVGEDELTACYQKLLERKHCYSAEGLSKLQEIYDHSVAELKVFTASPENADKVGVLIEERMALMRGVHLEKIYTADGMLITEGDRFYPREHDIGEKGYIGALWSQGGIPSDAELIIKKTDIKNVAELIRKAAKSRKVLVGAERASRSILKELRNCNVILGAQMSLGEILPEGGRYKVSILLPNNVDPAGILGVVFIRADGTVEFFEASPEEDMLEFETSHFSKYYVVSRGDVDLVPLIVCLGIIVICELCVLAILIIRRRKNKMRGLCGILPIPLILAVRYRPAGGNVIAIALGGAAVALGAAIGYLAYLELKDKKKQRIKEDTAKCDLVEVPRSVTVQATRKSDVSVEEKSEKEKTDSIRQPMESVSVEIAESLMSDSEALRLQKEESDEYEDIEIYHGEKKAEINIDVISENFEDGDTVTLNSLKEKKLVPQSAGQVKILARGVLDKRLRVVAQDFSGAAIKMILLTGGEAIITYSSSERGGKRKM